MLQASNFGIYSECLFIINNLCLYYIVILLHLGEKGLSNCCILLLLTLVKKKKSTGTTVLEQECSK